MNIYVCIKQVPDTETKIKINSDQTGIDTSSVKWIMSPYDELAVEEALQLKEKTSGNVTVMSAGPKRAKEAIRTALAMGADQGILIDIPETADNFMCAKAVAGALKKEGNAEIIFCGKEAIDDGAAQFSQFLSKNLEIPCVTVVLDIEYGEGKVTCKREVEGGTIETIETSLPAVIATQKGLNEPRYASLPNIMKAKKKEIKTLTMGDIGVSESDQKIRHKNFELPPPKQAGKKIEGDVAAQAKELAKLLREEAKVI